MVVKPTATHNGQMEFGGFGWWYMHTFFDLGLSNIAKIGKYL